MIQCLTLRRQVVTTARRRRGRSRVNRTGKDACGHARNQRRIATPPDCTCAKAIDNVFVEDHCGYVLVCIGRQAFDTINWVAFLRRCGCSATGKHSNQMEGKAQPCCMQPAQASAVPLAPFARGRGNVVSKQLRMRCGRTTHTSCALSVGSACRQVSRRRAA